MSFATAYALEGLGYALAAGRLKAKIDQAQAYTKVAKWGLDYLTKNKKTKMAKTRSGRTAPKTPVKKKTKVVYPTPKKGSSVGSGSRRSSVLSSSMGGYLRPSGVVNMKSNQSMVSVAHKRTKKGFKAKKRKYVKVTPQFKKKVNQVLLGKKVTGTARLVLIGGYSDMRPNTAITQRVSPLPLPRVDTRATGCLFGWEQIMYMASRLWNGRLRPATSDLAQLFNETGNFSVGVYNNSIPTGFSVEVTSLKARTVWRNNSKTAHQVVLYVCKPKHQRRDIQTTLDGKPILEWNTQMGMEISAKVNGGVTTNALTKSQGINRGAAPTDLYATPGICKGFSKLWNYDQFKFTLEPGQEHTHWIQGDEKVYDFAKMYKKTDDSNSVEFCNIQPSDRHIFYTSTPRMSTYITGTPGVAYSGWTGEPDGYGVDIYTEIYCVMKMPETAGSNITIPATTGNATAEINYIQPITERKRGYFVDTFTAQADTDLKFSGIYSIDDNNPTNNLSLV